MRFSSPVTCRDIGKQLDPEDERITSRLADAFSSVSIKDITSVLPVSDDAVKQWRRRIAMPGSVRLIKACRVPLINAAVVELTTQGEATGPEHFRLIAPLLGELSAIAGGEDQVSAYRARKALQGFADELAAMRLPGHAIVLAQRVAR
jgi:hypothetical protein